MESTNDMATKVAKNTYHISTTILLIINSIGHPLVNALGQLSLTDGGDVIQYHVLLPYIIITLLLNFVGWLAICNLMKWGSLLIWKRTHRNIWIDGPWYGCQINPADENYFRWVEVTFHQEFYEISYSEAETVNISFDPERLLDGDFHFIPKTNDTKKQKTKWKDERGFISGKELKVPYEAYRAQFGDLKDRKGFHDYTIRHDMADKNLPPIQIEGIFNDFVPSVDNKTIEAPRAGYIHLYPSLEKAKKEVQKKLMESHKVAFCSTVVKTS